MGWYPEHKVWNEYAGCWDDPPTNEQCEKNRKTKCCPYPSCFEYPCWEEG